MILLTTLSKQIDAPIRTTATLDIDTRLKSRAKIILDNGEPAGWLLPRGLLLRGGDLLTDDDGTTIIQIIAKPETVSTAYCTDPLTLAKACYHLGNRHVPLQITPTFVRYQHDHVLDAMLAQMSITVTVEQAPFEPEAGAYQNTPHHEHHH